MRRGAEECDLCVSSTEGGGEGGGGGGGDLGQDVELAGDKLKVSLAQLLAGNDAVAIKVERLKERFEGYVVARGVVTAPQQVAAQFFRIDRAAAVGVDHVEERVRLRVVDATHLVRVRVRDRPGLRLGLG